MDYKNKYLKYKSKYLKLKILARSKMVNDGHNSFKLKQLFLSGGTTAASGHSASKDKPLIAINFEGGKIIKHILGFGDQCLGYVNCQIAMDAPYNETPRVADEKVRSVSRSELQFKGYDEEKLKGELEEIFAYIKSIYTGKKIVIQIARGRAASPTFREVILPVFLKLSIVDKDYDDEKDREKYRDVFEVVSGYRQANYYVPTDDKPFVFFNYGMIGMLSDDDTMPGDICNPVITYDITGYDNDGFKYEGKTEFGGDSKNILSKFGFAKPLILFGIADEMKFITPADYKKEHVQEMLKSIE